MMRYWYLFMGLLSFSHAWSQGEALNEERRQILNLDNICCEDSLRTVYVVNLSGCQEYFGERFEKEREHIFTVERFDTYYNFGTGNMQTIVNGGVLGNWSSNVGSCHSYSIDEMAGGYNRSETFWRGLDHGDLWAYLCISDSVCLDSCICDRYLADEVVYWSALQLQKKYKKVFFGVILQEDVEKLPTSVREKNITEFLLEKYGADLVIGLRRSAVRLQIQSANTVRGKMAKINLTGDMKATYQCLWEICSASRKTAVAGNYFRHYEWDNVRYELKMSEIVPPLRVVFEELGKEAGDNFAGRE